MPHPVYLLPSLPQKTVNCTKIRINAT
jgi:hypothetical protein